MQNNHQELRKLDHIELALKAQSNRFDIDQRFDYEPLLNPHPTIDFDLSKVFLDKKCNAPLWISSMTGGVGPAKHINQNLARVAFEFKFGIGLGSCRVLIEDDAYFNDFNLRPILGPDLPLYANLGIAQVEQLLLGNNHHKILNLVNKLDANGLIVHINPLQEWFQPEGDRLKLSPLETLTRLCSETKINIIVKEVGQGFGPKSLKALLDLPIVGLELAGFGGTNFTKLEQLRSRNNITDSALALANIGHTAADMVANLNKLSAQNPTYKNKQIIISGGVENVLDGYFLLESLQYNAVIGQAKNFLIHAENLDSLRDYTFDFIEGLKMAKSFLTIKEKDSLWSK